MKNSIETIQRSVHSSESSEGNEVQEKITEYAQRILNISDIKKAEEIIKNIRIEILSGEKLKQIQELNVTNSENQPTKIKTDSRITFDESQSILGDNEKFEKNSVISITPENEIAELSSFIKKNKDSFKEGVNLFFGKYGNNPQLIRIEIDSMDDINENYKLDKDDNLDTFGYLNNDVIESFRKNFNFITPDKIKG